MPNISSNAKILVLGDFIADVYWSTPGSAFDALTGAARSPLNFHFCPGGAANVAHWLIQLGQEFDFVDPYGLRIRGKPKTEPREWWRDELYARIFGSTRMVHRLIVGRQLLAGSIVEPLARPKSDPTDSQFESQMLQLDMMDYGVGLLADYGISLDRNAYRQHLQACRAASLPVFADPGPAHVHWCQGAFVVKLNQIELQTWASGSGCSGLDLRENLRSLRRSIRATHAVVSMGGSGALMVSPDDRIIEMRPSLTAESNAIGAGDALLAALAAFFLRDGNMQIAFEKAVETAASAVTNLCTCPPTLNGSLQA